MKKKIEYNNVMENLDRVLKKFDVLFKKYIYWLELIEKEKKMEDKYQKSLNHIGYFEGFVLLKNLVDSDIKNMQELIDKQADYMSYQDLKAEYESKLNKLEKALDIACYNYILEKLKYKVSEKTCTRLAQEEKKKLLESEK